jgi:prohibitin 2
MLKAALVLMVGLLVTGCGCEVVDTGHRGIEKRFGEVQGEPLTEGLRFYNPITSSIVELSVREEKMEGKTLAFTRDTQSVTIEYSLTFQPTPSKINKLYVQLGEEWAEKIVHPLVLQSIKDVIGQYVADDLVQSREAARSKAYDELRNTLAARDVTVTQLAFTNLDFDDAYEEAVEAKVVAVQKAAQAKNKTVEIEERAKQAIIAARAEAESMTIRSQALSQNKGLVEYEAVQKWNGKLPTYMMGSTVPFINLSTVK